MSEYEYLLKRQAIAEQAARALMVVVMETMSPPRIRNINRIGFKWDESLDALDAERAARTAAQSSTDQKG